MATYKDDFEKKSIAEFFEAWPCLGSMPEW